MVCVTCWRPIASWRAHRRVHRRSSVSEHGLACSLQCTLSSFVPVDASIRCMQTAREPEMKIAGNQTRCLIPSHNRKVPASTRVQAGQAREFTAEGQEQTKVWERTLSHLLRDCWLCRRLHRKPPVFIPGNVLETCSPICFRTQ